ncbi:MAG TPA: PilZ domain-containing protein, partial [Candidatus Acidoferrum sp.]|nr:PilZ domain-containing protein [Candidatus Acidoferrum sp.]
MSAKRRNRKRKLRPDTKPVEQSVFQVETEPAASVVEIQEELENFGSTASLPEESEILAGPVVERADREERVPDSGAKTGADRRSHPRYAFTAAVEVIAEEPGARLKTRVRDLSQQGCNVDTENPFALGTVTEVHITKGAESFEAHARVVYNQPGKGMGLMFTVVEPEQLAIL